MSGDLDRPRDVEWTTSRLPTKVGEVAGLFRYPVKSMSGEPLEVAELGWHGLHGDRRLAFRRLKEPGGFPWLSASKLPELILFAPVPRGLAAAGDLPTHVRTPEGEELAVFGPELATEVGRRHGSPVEMLHLNRGIFDDAPISVIASATVGEIGRLAAQPPDVRRFRPNILIASLRSVPFEEDEWVGGVLSFGETEECSSSRAAEAEARPPRSAMHQHPTGGFRPAPAGVARQGGQLPSTSPVFGGA